MYLFALILYIDLFIYSARARSVPQEEQGIELEELNHEVDEWEIPRDRITLHRSIGFGAFGAVWKATLRQPNEWPREKIVAAKCFTREN